MHSSLFRRARHRNGAILLAVVCVLCLSLHGRSFAQSSGPEAHRPRVCIVLSGGGALGFAHVGVLRALEDMHVPVDCVAGTSMGALVGGLYASGYSPSELENLGHTLDWGAMFRDVPDRQNLPYRRKLDDLTYLSRLEFGISRKGLKMPSGFVAGHRVGVALRVLTLRAAGISDFDRLPLAFRAVATDATTGEPVVLGRGDLGTALHASMAIPGLFAPVEVDGRVLVDGGVVNNLPVDAARAMGADVIIAVDVGEPLATRERPESIATILSGSLGALSRREVERQLALADIAIRPKVSEYGLFSFDDPGSLVQRGMDATEVQGAALRRLALDDAAWQQHVAAQRRSVPALKIATVTVDPSPGLNPGVVGNTVRTRPGRELDPVQLAADLDRIWEHGDFESVDFSLTRGANDLWDLGIRARPKAWGPNYLRAGLTLASDLEGSSSFDALAALTMTRVNRLGAEIKVSLRGGESTVAQAEFYQPLSNGGVPFVALSVAAGPTKVQVPVGNESVQYRFTQQRAVLDVGLALGRWGEFRTGVVHDTVTGRSTDSHIDDAPRFDRTDAGLRAGLVIDQLDRVNFPRHGVLAIAELYQASASLGADDDYRRADLQFVGAVNRGRHTVLGIARAGSALGGQLPPSVRLQFGGLFSLSGLPPGELSGSYGGTAAMVYMYRLGRAPKFVDGIYVGGTIEAGNAWERASDVDLGDLRHSIALVFGVDTLVGPIYVAHGWTTGGKDSFYFYLGRSF